MTGDGTKLCPWVQPLKAEVALAQRNPLWLQDEEPALDPIMPAPLRRGRARVEGALTLGGVTSAGVTRRGPRLFLEESGGLCLLCLGTPGCCWTLGLSWALAGSQWGLGMPRLPLLHRRVRSLKS